MGQAGKSQLTGTRINFASAEQAQKREIDLAESSL